MAMTRFLVVSGRSYLSHLADNCAFEFEDVLVSALDGELLTLPKQRPAGGDGPARRADVAFFVAINFKKLAKLVQRFEEAGHRAELTCGYVFGGYAKDARWLMHPVLQKGWQRYKAIAGLDRLFSGIGQEVETLSRGLRREVIYLPMAADVLKVAAEPGARPIAVNGFGRQDPALSRILSEEMNRPGSPDLYFHTDMLAIDRMTDWARYRAMFWQLLRQSRLALAFDQCYANPEGRSVLSYVGPRWFECLAAGTVVVGQAPRHTDRARLLDWPDAAIDLPEDPRAALEAMRALLRAPDRLRDISERNLAEMNRRHDWRHRIQLMLDSISVDPPPTLRQQLDALAGRSERFARAGSALGLSSRLSAG